MVADWFESNVPVLMANVAEEALAGTLTEEGTVNALGALLVSVTTELPVVGFDSATVHVELALEARLAGEHWREVRVTGVI
jgi:hypothetical protein